MVMLLSCLLVYYSGIGGCRLSVLLGSCITTPVTIDHYKVLVLSQASWMLHVEL